MEKIYLFKKGEVVSFLNDTGTARILEVRADGTALVETEDGFEYPYPCSELVPRFDLREKEPEPAPEPKMITEMEGFRLGQKVSMAHEDMDGVIMEFDTDGRIRVEWEDLITSWYRPGELRVPGEAEQVKLAESLETASLEEIGEAPQKEKEKHRKEEKGRETWEVDLHIHELVDNPFGMPKHEIVQLQLDTFDKRLREAMFKGIGKVVFIHGRGEGRLRNAIRSVMDRYPNCEYLDADYSKYGNGATEVRILWKSEEED